MPLKSKCYNYKILRTVLEMIDSMFCYIEDKITALSWQSFSIWFPFSFSESIDNKKSDPCGWFGNIIISEIIFEFQRRNDGKENVCTDYLT